MYIELDGSREFEGSRKALGDVDILFHEGLYHLYHLVLPNHDYVAHAVSRDGIHWQRVENAIFVGHPGSWDDSMLWTMHVTPDPHRPGKWRMFYTGISRRDKGLKQRLGLAYSDDLYHWKKAPVGWTHNGGDDSRPSSGEASLITAPLDPESCFPLEPTPDYYESELDEGRHWISWRDPYYYREDGRGWLICSGRVKDGPVVRRGCVAAMEEVGVDRFENRPPMHHPGLYDDIEVPNLIKVEGEHYLIGSIREDAKIRYWHAEKMGEPWKSYHDNVLLGEGNYAGRVCHDGRGLLIWSFFSKDISRRDVANILPPPKRLVRTPSGLLRVQTFERILERSVRKHATDKLELLQKNDLPDRCETSGDVITLSGCAGFQAFVFPEELDHFHLAASFELDGPGKCGIVFRLDRETHDGYYLSLDLMKGVAQIRDWGTDHGATGEEMMHFHHLQSGYWFTRTPGKAKIQLVTFGSYLELSIDDRVVLSLANSRYAKGAAGFYFESSRLQLRDVILESLEPPAQSDEHLAVG